MGVGGCDTIKEMPILVHDRDDGVDVEAGAVHGVQVGVHLRFLEDIMDLGAAFEYLNAFVLLSLEQAVIILQVHITLWVHSSLGQAL